MKKLLLLLWIMLTMFLFSCSAESEVEPKTENITEETQNVWANDNETIEETYEEVWEGGYIGSVNSDVYHYPYCRWVEKIYEENRIEFETVQDAKNQGYRRCYVCGQ